MARGQAADAVESLDELGGAQPAANLVLGVIVDHLVQPLNDLAETGHIGHRDEPAAPHGHGLEVLGGHHCAHPRASRRTVEVDEHPGETHSVLRPLADGGYLDVGVAKLLLNGQGGVPHILAPQPPRIPQLHHVILDPEVDRALCPTVNDHLVVPGELELRTKEAAGVGVTQDAGLRGHGGDVEPRPAGEERPHQRANAKDQHVLWRESIGVGRQFVPETFHVEPPPAEKSPGQVLLGGVVLNGAIGQIDP